MASPQLEKGFVRIAYELQDEILRRNFTKRQQNIILFVLRLSYGTGRKDCVIDKFIRFEIAGIDRSDVKNELKYLRTCKVINWSEDTMIFSINKDYDYWQVSPNKKWDEDKFKELIHLNLSKKNVGILPTSEQESNNNYVGKTPTKKRTYVGKIQTGMLVKHQQGHASIPCESKADQGSIDSIIDNIKDSKDHDGSKISLWGDYQNVKLSQDQYDELVEKYSDDDADHFIERLSSFIYEKGARVNDHYATIEKWIKQDRGEEVPVKRTTPIVENDAEAERLRREYREAIKDNELAEFFD